MGETTGGAAAADPDPAIFHRLADLRAAPPLVHAITNYVAMDVTANVLLAAGAAPAMIHAREEAAEFAAIASALSVNIGTLSADWLAAMLEAAAAARAAGKPWVLDPVAVGATGFRREAGARLLALKPTVIRGNASEILALAGRSAAGRGVDSGDETAAAEAAAIALARTTGGVVAATGATDFVTDGRRRAWIDNGAPIMTRVTALGCALSAVVAAFAAVRADGRDDDPFAATIAALSVYGVAGEQAAEGCETAPATFRTRFIDMLAALDVDALAARARVHSRDVAA